MKSDNLRTPDVLTSRSSGGQFAVSKWLVMVCSVMLSKSVSAGVAVESEAEEDAESSVSLAGECAVVESETMLWMLLAISWREV